MLAQELEKCRTQLYTVIAELEKLKKASSGKFSLHRETKNDMTTVLKLLLCVITGSLDQLEEKLKAAQTSEKEAKRQHAAGERVLTRVREEKNKLQDSNTQLGEELKDVRAELADSVKENKRL